MATLCVVAATPMPVKVCAVGEFAASLENEIAADAAPAVAGLKVTEKEADWPGARVTGKEIPASSNWLLPLLAAEIVTDDPLACKAPVNELLSATDTLPKFKLAGEIDNWPSVSAEPASATSSVGPAAVETMARVPLADPDDAGVKVTVKVALWLAARVIGKLGPVTEKPAPLIFAAEIVIGEPLVFVTVSERLELLLWATLPKASGEADAVNAGAGAAELLRDTPPQPVSSKVLAVSTREVTKQRYKQAKCKGRLPQILSLSNAGYWVSEYIDGVSLSD